jgi:hypothetical protein
MHHFESSCLLQKLNIYLAGFLGEDLFKKIGLVFVIVGPKYGVERAADYCHKRIADACAEEQLLAK